MVPKFRKVSESQVASHQPTSPPTTSAANDSKLTIARTSAPVLPAVAVATSPSLMQGTDW